MGIRDSLIGNAPIKRHRTPTGKPALSPALVFAWANSAWRVGCRRDMKVFVAGGAGYIGSICVEELLSAGHQVTVFDNLSEGHRVAVDERAQFIEGCLSDRETIINAVAADRPEAVTHCAAFDPVGEAMNDPSMYFSNNVAYGLNVLDAST